jgi:hypothetical protein
LQLDPRKIIETAERLTHRIQERFGETGLVDISQEVHRLATLAEQQSEDLASPVIAVRILVVIAIALLVSLMLFVFVTAIPSVDTVTAMNPMDRLSSVDAGLEQLAAVGIAVVFLITLETRIKRDRAFKAIHSLRAIAHVIDMHQLTKDPGASFVMLESTESSPERTLSPAELVRYLDYCSELLSILGKISALYIQEFRDPVALASASEFEGLTRGLSQKIWQKIIISEKLQRPQED